jgi:hypothetical protein
MPERDAVTCNLGDGYLLIAAGLRREKSSELTADLMLQNGKVLYAERGILNTVDGRHAWSAACAAKAEGTGGPTAERMADALQEHVLPDALAVLQVDGPKKPTQADMLVGMVFGMLGDFATDVAEAVELFHDPGGNAFATIPVGDHAETWPLHSKGFRQWMARRFHEQHGKTPNAQALADATAVLAGKALYDGPEYEVHLRIAEQEGAIFIDLCDESWRAIAVDRAGWRIVTRPPVKFRRTKGMLPLPIPIAGGTLADLRQFINVPASGDAPEWVLSVAWLIGAFRPRGPYPVLVTIGGQGRAKSTLHRMLRALIDPNKAAIRTLPRDGRDLMIAASNSWCAAYDNVSHLADWQSDALCRLSTGGGFATRELYTDLDETILDAQRPVMLNGIEEIVTRADLLDRALLVLLPQIGKGRRRPEKVLWADFEQARPALLGAILDVLVVALANEEAVQLDDYPRMADFATWIVAAESALPWQPGAFLAAYRANQENANDVTLEASPVAQAVRDFMQGRPMWVGTATELLGELETVVNEKTTKQKSWPGSGQTLSNQLRRLAANLEAVGTAIIFDLKIKGRRALRLSQTEREENEASPASPASSSASEHGEARNSGGDTSGNEVSPSGRQASPQDDEVSPQVSPQEPAQRRENSGEGDTSDASMPPHSVSGDARAPEDAGYDQAAFDEARATIPMCQRCDKPIDRGVYCDDCDPYGM